VALAVLIFFASRTLAAKRAQLKELNAERDELGQRLLQIQPDADRIKALKNWTGTAVNWLDEFYDLTARFPRRPNFRVNLVTALPWQGDAKAKDKDKRVARIVINGSIKRQEIAALNAWVDEINRDGHCRASVDSLKSNLAGSSSDASRAFEEFTLRVDLMPHPSSAFTTRLSAGGQP
jgi:hypothetical protein